MTTVLEATQNFLTYHANQGIAPDLLAKWNRNMETQINVAAGDGERVEGKHQIYTDGIAEWWNIRVPKNANAEPEFRDYQLQWPLDNHAEAIGSTGWDWVNRSSCWVGFDFDSISGHARGVGIDDEELAKVREKATALPYVEVRKSTGGKGLHLYVFLDNIPTANHTEHAALARCALSIMSGETGFDFSQHIDCCGGNMWIWHRKVTPENEGLSLLKASEQVLSIADLPANWRDHIEVVTKRRTKIRINGVSDDDLGPFEKLTSGRKNTPQDDTHKAIIQALSQTGYSCIWVPEYHLLQTHTKAIEKIYNDPEVDLQGVFQTNSSGSDPGEPNCFLRPLPNGAFQAYRFSPGTAEAKTWTQDGRTWTTCPINAPPSFATACIANNALKDPESGGYVFEESEDAVTAALSLGEAISFPEQFRGRYIYFIKNKFGKLIVKVPCLKGEPKVAGWLADKRQTYWVLEFDRDLDAESEQLELEQYDAVVRKLYSTDHKDMGWRMMVRDGSWCEAVKDDIKDVLAAHGNNPGQTKQILGNAGSNPWRMVNLPFQPEYVGDRQWNLYAPQLVYQPANFLYDELPKHPHWDLVMNHLGRSLDSELAKLPWAKEAGILCGGDYLKSWAAAMFREPFLPLPYLFFHGVENCGKSLFHEALGALMTSGYNDAKNALTDKSGFNGGLLGAVLCYVEEIDLSKSPTARNLIKEWVTSEFLAIRKMRTDTFMVPNMTKWVQTANDRSYCQIFPGDTRITSLHVSLPKKEIPKEELKKALLAEASHFMATLMDMQLPEMTGRLRIPIVVTDSKREAQRLNGNLVEQFIEEHGEFKEGERVLFSKFYEAFQAALGPDDAAVWTKAKTTKNLPEAHKTVSGTGNKRCVPNLTLAV